MTRDDATNEWWLRMFVFTGCAKLVVRDITFADAPFWGLQLLDFKGDSLSYPVSEP